MADQVFDRKWSIWMADTVLEKFPEFGKHWGYGYGVVCKGLEYVYKQTGDKRYFDYIKSNVDRLLTEDGTIKYYDMSAHNIDFINNGKILLFLYKETGEAKYLTAAKTLRAQLAEHPRTSEGGFWHKDMYPHQMWLDGLYMGQPFYAEYIKLFEKENGWDDVVLQFKLVDKHLKNPKTNLLYHGWDESKSMFWANKETGQSPHHWGRAMGWYACALVDTLDHIENTSDRDVLIKMVQNLAEGIVNVQSKKNGLWCQVLDMEDAYGNYYESSCSCMFSYFLFKAVSKGYIDAQYYDNAQKGIFGVIREHIELDQNGLLNLHNTVFCSGLGGGAFRDGSYDYYISEPKQTNNLLGVGAFIMAAAELDKN